MQRLLEQGSHFPPTSRTPGQRNRQRSSFLGEEILPRSVRLGLCQVNRHRYARRMVFHPFTFPDFIDIVDAATTSDGDASSNFVRHFK